MIPLYVNVGVSRRLRIFLWLAHGMACVAWVVAIKLWWLRMLGAGMLLGSAIWHDRKQRVLQLTTIEASGEGYRLHWRGVWHEAVLQEALVTAPLTVANFRCAGRRVDAVLLRDNVDAEAYRRLRVWLRWGRIKKQPDLF